MREQNISVSDIGNAAKLLIDSNKNCDWTIHSVFKNACNLELSDKGLITLLQPASPLSPIGLRLREHIPDMRNVFGEEFCVKTVCSQSGNNGSVYCNINVERAEVVDCTFSYNNKSLKSPGDAYSRIAKMLVNKPCEINSTEETDWVNSVVKSKCKSSVEMMRRALLQGNSDLFVESAKSIIGLGKGLTPTGDDVLSGFIATVRFLPEYKKMIDTVAPILSVHIRNSTTRVSAEFLVCMLACDYSECLTYVLDCMVYGGKDDLDEAIRKLLRVGSSTGLDTLFGILSGLELFSTPT